MHETPNGAFHWNELMTHDLAKAKAFYAELCGWSYQEMPMPDGMTYTVAMAGEQPVGGLFPMSGAEFEGAPDHWIGYVAVADADKAAAAVEAGGGELERAPFDVEEVGRIAILKDPGGAVIGVITPAPPPTQDA